MPRYFTGLEIPNEVSFALSLKRGGLGKSRWIEPPSYHITLRYIGEVDQKTANEISDLLEGMQVNRPFSVTLNRLGVFGGNRPRMLWAGLEKCDEIQALHEEQDRALHMLGLPADGRKYTPHVTLARLNGVTSEEVAMHIEHAGAFTPLTFQVSQFVLYSAKGSMGGGPYVVEERYPLAA